jgi:ribosomal protein L11 methyltransferase
VSTAHTGEASNAATRTPQGARVIRLAVRVRREQAELVLADLLEIAPSGVEEAEVGGDVVEYAVYGAAGELPQLPDLRAAAGGALVEISTSELADDWSERWKSFHRPVLIEPPLPEPARHAGRAVTSAIPTLRPAAGAVDPTAGVVDPAVRARRPAVPALHIRPPWEGASERGDVEEIVIDPGQAFGTGAHATTRLCLELLLELASEDERRGPLLDMGTGSGVLAIAGARLGYAPVLALDHDPESVAAAVENAAVNGTSIEVSRFDLRRERLSSVEGEGGFTVLANLLLPLLLDLARSMESAPRNLIASGLLVEQVDGVVDAFGERLGLRERERRASGEWAAVWLQRDA